jgi:hypothetical protein
MVELTRTGIGSETQDPKVAVSANKQQDGFTSGNRKRFAS